MTTHSNHIAHKGRWAVYGVLLASYAFAFFQSFTIGMVKQDLMMNFELTSKTFAFIGSMYFYSYMIMQIPTGLLVDYYGVRKVAIFGNMISGIGSLIFGLSQSVWMLVLGRMLVGLGASVIFVSALKVQSVWFSDEEYGTLSGITTFTGKIGGVIAQVPLALLISAVTWRWAFVLIGGLTLVISAMSAKWVHNSPQERDGRIRQDSPKNDAVGLKKYFTDSLEIALNPHLWIAFVVYGCFFGTFMSFTGTWGNAYFAEVGNLSKVTAANYVTSAILGLALGSLAIGKLSDRLRKRKLPILIFGFAYLTGWTVFTLVFKGQPPASMISPLLFLIGFGCAAFVLIFGYVKELSNPEFSGFATALVNVGGFLGAGIVPMGFGIIIDHYVQNSSLAVGYHYAFVYSLMLTAVGFLLSLTFKETGCQNIFISTISAEDKIRGKIIQNQGGSRCSS